MYSMERCLDSLCFKRGTPYRHWRHLIACKCWVLWSTGLVELVIWCTNRLIAWLKILLKWWKCFFCGKCLFWVEILRISITDNGDQQNYLIGEPQKVKSHWLNVFRATEFCYTRNLIANILDDLASVSTCENCTIVIRLALRYCSQCKIHARIGNEILTE